MEVESGATDLMKMLIRRGYFEDDHSQESSNPPLPTMVKDDLETFRASRAQQQSPSFKFSGPGIIESSSTSQQEGGTLTVYYSPGGLAVAVRDAIVASGGRSNCRDIASKCRVQEDRIWSQNTLLETDFSVERMGPELVHVSYWEKLRCQIEQEVEEKESISISDLATKHSLSMTILLQKCIQPLQGKYHDLSLKNHTRMIVTDSFRRRLVEEILDFFASVEDPVTISAVSNEHGWDMDFVLKILKENSDNLKGDLHADESSSSSSSGAGTALYTPHSYNEKRHHELIEYVTLNRYVTSSHASNRFNMPLSQMENILQEAVPSIINFGNVCWVQDHLLQSLKEALEEPDVESVDLGEILPIELIQPEYVNLFLKYIEFDGKSGNSGVVIAVEDTAKMFSSQLVKEIRAKILPPLIERFAKARANKLMEQGPEQSTINEMDIEDASSAGKSRRKGKRKNNKRAEERTIEIGVVPLLEVAGAVLKEFAEIMPEDSEERLLEEAESIAWSDEEGRSSIFVVEFCMVAFFDDEFRSQCEKAVLVELQQLKSSKESKATVSRKDAATQVRNVQSAFEESFTNSCYLIQTMSKFINLASASSCFNEEQLELLKKDFLVGPCADLTSRITQYCLFKEDSDDFFTFQDMSKLEKSDENNEESSGLPAYCAPLDIALRVYEGTYLSCPPPRDPLPILRETLPGSVGVSLARQWILCGGQTYKGGTKSGDSDNSTDFIRPGDAEGILVHMEENCL